MKAIGGAARVAAAQHGIITRRQLHDEGISDHVISRLGRDGLLVRLAPGVHRWQGSPSSWHQQAMAAVKAAGPTALVSHQSAAVLHQLAGFRPGRLHVVVEAGVARASRRATVHRAVLTPADRAVVDGIPVVGVALTLVQVAATVTASRLEDALDDALCRGLVTLSGVAAACSRGRAGSARVARVAALWASDETAGSVPEARLLRRILAAGLPRPAVQHEIRDGGRLVARADLAYPEQAIAVEYDSFRWHGARRSHAATAIRRNRLEALGWRVIVATSQDRDDGGRRLAATLTALLRGAS